MKRLFLLMALLLPLVSMAQKAKIEVEDGKIYLDDSLYARMDRERGNGGMWEYTIRNRAKETIIIVRTKHEKDFREIGRANPNGTVVCYDFLFTKSKQTAQVSDAYLDSKRMAKLLIKYELIKNKDIDQDAVDNFVLLYPVKY